MSVIACIPARGGSKGVFKKNIKIFNGHPLIGYTIFAAKQSKHIDRVIVSTDDEEIAEVAKEYGAEVPFLRPAELAQDCTPDRPVIDHLLEELKSQKHNSELLLWLRPTTPFKKSVFIDDCIEKIQKNEDYTSLRTVTEVQGKAHPYWVFKEEKGKLKEFVEGIKFKDYYQRQLLPKCYSINGLVDVIRPNSLNGTIDCFGECVGFLEINEKYTLDIDSERDFSFGEYLLSKDIELAELLNN